ncbi:hypothetical protein I4U23_019235 [Adineta vaga]|nr:hypothetical protein I4U23_019235 [Adineta vaga]
MLITQKINTPEYRALLTPHLLKLAELFRANQYEIRVAGGAVRDILMGILPHDIDFATTATPEQMKDMFTQANIRMINCNGEEHGTITARIDDRENFEITTLRIDKTTDGRHAEVEYTQDWQLDANRRDLTINSLFLDFNGTVYDYFNGIEDLQHRRICFVGDAVQRIREDYLRILRYFRFFGRFAPDNAIHDEQTLKAIRDNVEGLKDIAGERLWIELKLMLEQNIGPYLGIPSDADANQLEDHWQQSYQAKPHEMTILTKLFRNTHEVRKFEQRLKYSNDCRRLSQLLITYRDSISLLDSSSTDRLKPYKDLVIDLIINDPMAKERIVELLKYQHHLSEAQQLSDWTIPRFPVTGNMLTSKGIKQGPNFKLILNALRDNWKQSHFQATENQLIDEVLPHVLETLAHTNPNDTIPKKRKEKE